MSQLDDLAASIRKLGRKLSFEGHRTANLARLKMDLKSLDIQRRDVRARLGEKLYDLKRRRSIKDEWLLENLGEQFDELDDLERKTRNILDLIQKESMSFDSEVKDADYEDIKNDK
jgi:CRISPR/Cas system-associated protein Cas5 (RAMP superfamily)